MFRLDDTGIYVGMNSQAEAAFFVDNLGATHLKSKTENKCRLPRTLGAMTELFNKVPRLRQDKDFIEAGFILKQERDEILAYKAEETELPSWDDLLRPYQRHDVYFLNHLEAAGIFNEPRTGKTPTLLGVINTADTKLNLIIAPASLLYTWKVQVEKWLPYATPYVIIGSKNAAETITEVSKAKGCRVLIISKNSLGKMPETFFKTNWDLAAVDEAHFLRKYETAQSKNVFRVKAKRRYALTGTPTVSGPDDIYGIMKFLYPKRFTSYWAMVNRYFNMQFDYMSGKEKVGTLKQTRKEEFQEMVGLLSTSRKRSEVMPWLPEKNRTELFAVMDDAQQKLYIDMQKMFFTMDEAGNELDANSVLAQITRLRQLALDPRMVGFKIVGCKTKLLMEYLSDRKSNGKSSPVAVMSMFTSYLKLLEQDLTKAKYRVGMLHGEMTLKEKQEAADKFQAGEYDVLLCNIITAGTGWTLDAGDTVVFMDTAWTPSEQEQAEDRVTPTVPERLHDHNIVNLITWGTVDSNMQAILARKEDLTAIINSGSRERILELIQNN